MKIAKTLLVLLMAIGLLAGCGTYHGKTGTVPVDAVLLEEPEVEVVQPTTVRIKDKVLFAFDSFKIDAEADATIEKVSTLMKKYPDTILALQGHTDKYGADDYNMTLSINRANAVKASLVDEGVAAERITSIEGFGKSQLIPNLTNRENRRVLILSIGE